MIYFDKVSKIYNSNSVALEDVTFQVAPGEFLSIVGHSGAGKTTLLKMLIVEDRPTDGSVFFESLKYSCNSSRTTSTTTGEKLAQSSRISNYFQT